MRPAVVRTASWTILAAAISCAVIVHGIAVVLPFDDAYIIFRYVENFWRGEGAVYNTGERVFGISSPLYAAWLAILKGALPALELSHLAARGNAIFLVLAGILIYFLTLRQGAGPMSAALTAGAVIISEGILRVSIGGMEAPLYLGLMAGALLALAARRDTTAVLLASLATLARPEGVLLLGTVVAAAFFNRGGSSSARFSRMVLIGLIPLAVWVLAATGYYGTPIPHSIVAKARPLYPLAPGTAFDEILARAGRWTLDGVHLLALSLSGQVGADQILAHPTPRWVQRWTGAALIVWILVRWWRPISGIRSTRTLALPVYFVLLVVGYAVSNPLLLLWYLPLLQGPLLMLGIAPGFGPSRSGWRWGFLKSLPPALLLCTAAVSFGFNLGPSYWNVLSYGGDNASRAVQMQSYVRAAQWVHSNSLPGDSVAATEIGLLGYLLDRRILDSCGLVSPEAVPFIPAPPEQRGNETVVMPVGFVRATLPEFVVSLPAYIRSSLLTNPWFNSAYQKAEEIPCLPGDPRFSGILIFRKRPGAGSRP